jgi:hypothetical protein
MKKQAVWRKWQWRIIDNNGGIGTRRRKSAESEINGGSRNRMAAAAA